MEQKLNVSAETVDETIVNIRKMFDIRRAFTTREIESIWSCLNLGVSPEYVALACEVSFIKTGQLSIRYAEKVAYNWFTEGYNTVEKVKELLSRKRDEKNGSQKRVNIRNWDGTENQVMKGYVFYALKMIKENEPELQLSDEQKKALFNGLRWATSDLTAEDAYRYCEMQNKE